MALAALMAAAIGSPSGASGSVTIGQTTGATDNCGSPQSMVQFQTVGGASYVAPSGGVITSWKYQAGASPQLQQPTGVRLKVYAPATPPTVWFLRSHSPSRPVTQNTLHPFTESPGIPIQAGDHLGLTALGGLQMGCISTGQLGDERYSNGGGGSDTTLNQNNMLNNLSTFARVDAEATIEPDADGDGFGDESQDQCPTDPSTQGTCSADVSITKVAAPEPVGVGQDLTYTITVTNNSSFNTATNAVVSDTLPPGATFKSSGASQGSCSGQATVQCSLGSIAAGATATATIVVTPTTGGARSNTATVSASTPDPAPANNSATATSTVSGSGGDTTAPAITLGGKRAQDVDKLLVLVRSNENATVRGRAGVGLPGPARVVRSRTARADVSAGQRKRLRIRFARKALGAIKKAIRAGRKPRARIRVTATDRAGNATAKIRRVRLTN